LQQEGILIVARNKSKGRRIASLQIKDIAEEGPDLSAGLVPGRYVPEIHAVEADAGVCKGKLLPRLLIH
jgi:hypothetical protein